MKNDNRKLKSFLDVNPMAALKSGRNVNVDDLKNDVILAADKLNLAMKMLQNYDQNFAVEKYESVRQAVETLFYDLAHERIAQIDNQHTAMNG